jgi:hypothetical protein
MDLPKPTTFTIRRILVLTFWLAFGFASIGNGGHYLTVFLAASFALVVGLGAHAFRAPHPFADFSRAFLFSLFLYFGVVAVMGKSSWDPIENRWPGTWLTETLYEAVVDRQWVDEQTKVVLYDFDPRRDPSFVLGDFAIARVVSPREKPNRFHFMLSLHLILGISLAFIPGQYAFALATRLHRKRSGEQRHEPKSSRVSDLQ